MKYGTLLLFALGGFLAVALAQNTGVVHFSGSIFAFPDNAVRQCLHDAVKDAKEETCYGDAEQATNVTTTIKDHRQTEKHTISREIIISYQ